MVVSVGEVKHAKGLASKYQVPDNNRGAVRRQAPLSVFGADSRVSADISF